MFAPAASQLPASSSQQQQQQLLINALSNPAVLSSLTPSQAQSLLATLTGSLLPPAPAPAPAPPLASGLGAGGLGAAGLGSLLGLGGLQTPPPLSVASLSQLAPPPPPVAAAASTVTQQTANALLAALAASPSTGALALPGVQQQHRSSGGGTAASALSPSGSNPPAPTGPRPNAQSMHIK